MQIRRVKGYTYINKSILKLDKCILLTNKLLSENRIIEAEKILHISQNLSNLLVNNKDMMNKQLLLRMIVSLKNLNEVTEKFRTSFNTNSIYLREKVLRK